MFAAIIARKPPASPRDLADPDALLAALTPFTPADVAGCWENERALICHAAHHNTPASLHEATPQVCGRTGRVIAGWVRLDNREQLCATLRLTLRPELTDPQIILAAHAQWGDDCAGELEGDFSFLIFDPRNGRTFCARDAMGAKPLFYTVTDNHLMVATSAAAMRAAHGLALTPSAQWMALVVSYFNFADDRSAFEEVRKLPRAHRMTMEPDGAIDQRRYFDFDLSAPHATTRDPAWVGRYREAFDRAVEVRAPSAFLVGAESSGGLDSSSVVARLAEVLPHDRADFHTFAMVTNALEPAQLRALSALCDVPHPHVLLRPKMLGLGDAFTRSLKVLGHPPEHAQSLVYPAFYDQAQGLGIRTILSGFGGDEMVTGSAKHLADELHSRRAYRLLFAETEGRFPRNAARFAKRLARGVADPDQTVRRAMPEKLSVSCLRRGFLEDTGLANRIERWMCPERGELTLNTMAALEPGFRHAMSARLESCANFAGSYGIEYRYPLLDRQLIAQYLATPSIEKRHRGMGRYLHRRAMQGRIPDSIVWQQSKSMGRFIGGTLALDGGDPVPYEELARPLREIIDARAFERAGAMCQDKLRQHDADVLQIRFFMWQVRMIDAWLQNETA